MENENDIIIRRVKRMSMTYFCDNDGQFSESFELPENVITDEDAYKYSYDCEKKLLLHHKQYSYCVFERRFFYTLSDGFIFAKNGNTKDTFAKYEKESGNIFVNGELTNLYRFVNSSYFKAMSARGKKVFTLFLKDTFKINLQQASGVLNFSALLLKFVVFKHETVDGYNDYAKFKKGDVYKPFGLKEEDL